MKKIVAMLLSSTMLLTGCGEEKNKSGVESGYESTQRLEAEAEAAAAEEAAAGGNFGDDMKIPYSVDLDLEAGADLYEREADYQESPYYISPDFYNMEDTKTLSILTNFRTQQQTSEWSSGLVSTMMVLDYFEKLSGYNESVLARMRSTGMEQEGIILADIVIILEELGSFAVTSSLDYPAEAAGNFMTLAKVKEYIDQDIPIIFATSERGGHWQVIIGYDTMGTDTLADDVIIVADPYDTNDHNQDGYAIYSAERLYSSWTVGDWFADEFSTEDFVVEDRDNIFCVAVPQ